MSAHTRTAYPPSRESREASGARRELEASRPLNIWSDFHWVNHETEDGGIYFDGCAIAGTGVGLFMPHGTESYKITLRTDSEFRHGVTYRVSEEIQKLAGMENCATERPCRLVEDIRLGQECSLQKEENTIEFIK